MFRTERLRPSEADNVPAGLVVITIDGHGLFEPAASYIADRSYPLSGSTDSLADEAYIICQWCNYLESHGFAWDTATESIFKRYIASGKKDGVGLRRLKRRISVVTWWYYFLARKNIGGARVQTFARALTHTDLDAGVIFPAPRFKVPRSPKNKNGRRNTPLDGDLEDILSALARHEDAFISERNHLLGSVVIATGVRAMGLHSLTLSFMDDLLRSVKILEPGECVSWYGGQKEQRDRIKTQLLLRDQRQVRPLYGQITEKGGRVRQIRFPVETVLLILDHIWGARLQLLRDKGALAGPNPIWISQRTGRAITLGRIKDILKLEGFNAAGIEGSGHRLRASFITMYCIKLLRAAWEQNRRVDGPTILAQLALVAGHASEDSLKAYLVEAAEILSRLQPEFQECELELYGKTRSNRYSSDDAATVQAESK